MPYPEGCLYCSLLTLCLYNKEITDTVVPTEGDETEDYSFLKVISNEESFQWGPLFEFEVNEGDKLFCFRLAKVVQKCIKRNQS